MIKKIKGKKGDSGLSTQQLIFYAGEIVVGAFLIAIFLSIIISSVRNSEAKALSTDITSTLQTMSSYPYPIYYEYPANVSEGSITITQESVRVNLNSGTHTTRLRLPKGIRIEEQQFINSKNIIFAHLDNRLIFSESEIKQLICEKLYKHLPQTKFFIEYEHTNQEQKQQIDLLKEAMQIIYDLDLASNKNKFILSNQQIDDAQLIKISFKETENETTISYDILKEEHKTFACFAQRKFSSPEYNSLSFTKLEQKEIEQIEIILPQINHLKSYIQKTEEEKKLKVRNDIELMQLYAKKIYEIITNTIE